MTLPDDSWTRGGLDLDPSPLCGNFLQTPCGHDRFRSHSLPKNTFHKGKRHPHLGYIRGYLEEALPSGGDGGGGGADGGGVSSIDDVMETMVG